MRPYLALKHKKFLDVFLVVSKVTDAGSYFYMSADWHNLGFTKSWLLLNPHFDFTLLKSDLHNWEYTEDEADCYRKANWHQLTASVLKS